jgi:hypothetical protein
MGTETLSRSAKGDGTVITVEDRDGIIYLVVTKGDKSREVQVPEAGSAMGIVRESGGVDAFLEPPPPPSPVVVPEEPKPAPKRRRRTKPRIGAKK